MFLELHTFLPKTVCFPKLQRLLDFTKFVFEKFWKAQGFNCCVVFTKKKYVPYILFISNTQYVNTFTQNHDFFFPHRWLRLCIHRNAQLFTVFDPKVFSWDFRINCTNYLILRVLEQNNIYTANTIETYWNISDRYCRSWVTVSATLYIYIYIYMGAARFPGPPNLHDLQNWFKQLILQLPICICIVQHVTWEIGLPPFIETVQGIRSAPHRSFTLHKVFQRVVKENKEK